MHPCLLADNGLKVHSSPLLEGVQGATVALRASSSWRGRGPDNGGGGGRLGSRKILSYKMLLYRVVFSGSSWGDGGWSSVRRGLGRTLLSNPRQRLSCGYGALPALILSVLQMGKLRLGLCPIAYSISGVHSHCPSYNGVICLPGLLGLWITYPWCRVLGLDVHGVSGTERLNDQRKEAQECQDRKWSWPVFLGSRPE